MVRTYTVRLELADDPDELLQAVDAIAADGGDVRSISYDRRDATPRGKVAVDLVIEVELDQFDSIVAEWSERGLAVVHTERERDSDSFTVLFDEAPTETALAATIGFLGERDDASIAAIDWTAADGVSDRSCTRLHVVVDSRVDGDPVRAVRRFVNERSARVVD